MKHQFLLILIFTIICAQSLSSQDGEYVTVRDFETWGSVNLNYKITKDWRIGLEEQVRLSHNSSKLEAYFTELNTRYDFNKHLYAGVGFRYLSENDMEGATQGIENHTRLHFDLGYKMDVHRFDIDYRLRYQTKNEVGITKDEGDYPSKHWRLKTTVGYNIKKWKFDPELSAEIFRHSEEGEVSQFNKFRMTVGTKYKTQSFGKFGLFYRMELALNSSYPLTTNIVGVKYTYTLKNKKKK